MDEEEQQMRLFLKKADCCGCGACVDICQAHAIRMLQDKEGFYYPHVDGSLCVCCGKCEKVCPIKNQSQQNCANQYLGAQAKSETVRYSGSSGGIFPILAEYIINRNGVVYGAGYNSHTDSNRIEATHQEAGQDSGRMEVTHQEAGQDSGRMEAIHQETGQDSCGMEVIHQEAGHLEQLERIKKTKYVQSSMQGVFLSVKQRLKEDRWVLFCGTPCQAQALRLFLGQKYDKLILADLVCYGVPSPGIWGDYVKYLESRHHGKMTDFSFRDKRARDHGHTCAYVINGVEYAGSLYQDRFCRMYFTDYTLRPSCYSCKFCTVDRDSDLTLGDFWGIEKVRPDVDDGMGTSMLILHTDKAREIWNQVQKAANWFECGKEDLMQPRLREPVGMPGGRAWFMMLYKLLPFPLFIRLMDCRKGLWKRVGMRLWKGLWKKQG